MGRPVGSCRHEIPQLERVEVHVAPEEGLRVAEHHVGAALRQLALYVDGAVAVTVPLAPAFLGAMTDDGASDPVTIGAGRASGTNALSFEFVGAIDDPAYYIEALAPAQIAAAAAAPDGYCP